MRIIGIDPGLGITGYGIIDADGKTRNFSLVKCGAIKTAYKTALQDRLVEVAEQLKAVLQQYQPDRAILEGLYSHYKHPVTAILMAHVRGVICFVCRESGVRVVDYPATRIKKAIVGRGNATKSQVQKMVQTFLNLKEIKTPDITDALALALGHVFIGRE